MTNDLLVPLLAYCGVVSWRAVAIFNVTNSKISCARLLRIGPCKARELMVILLVSSLVHIANPHPKRIDNALKLLKFLKPGLTAYYNLKVSALLIGLHSSVASREIVCTRLLVTLYLVLRWEVAVLLRSSVRTMPYLATTRPELVQSEVTCGIHPMRLYQVMNLALASGGGGRARKRALKIS